MDDLTSDKKAEDAGEERRAAEEAADQREAEGGAEAPVAEKTATEAASVVEAEDGVLEADFGDSEAPGADEDQEELPAEPGAAEGTDSGLADGSQVAAETEGAAAPQDAEFEPEAAAATTATATASATAGAGAAAKPANLRWDMLFWLLLICVSLVRLGYLYILPLDLSPAESSYWDWSRQLDLGYYSQPPLIAWINSLPTKLLGVSAEVVRLPAVIFATLGLIGIYLCGRRMFSAEVGFWAAAAWLATPGSAVLSLLMTPEALLVGYWCLALYTLWRTIDAVRGRFFWGFLTLLLVGAGFLSSLLMLLFPLLMFLYLLCSVDRRQLKMRWPWLLSMGWLLFLLPLLYWNFQHDWITFKYTAGQLAPVAGGWPERLQSLGEFVGIQLGLWTPLTWLLLLVLLVSLLSKVLRWSRQTRYLFFFSAFGLLACLGLSFWQPVNPNWPATFYPAGLLLLAAWGRQQIHGGMFNRLQRLFMPALKIAVVFTLLACLLPFLLQLSFIPLGEMDPTRRFKGWSEMGQQVGAVLQEQPRPEETFLLATQPDYPSAVAFYAPGQPRTYQWPANPQQVTSQHDLWFGPLDKSGWDALILHDAGLALPEDLIAAFDNVVDLGEQRVSIGAAGTRAYHLWRGENLQTWPE